MSFWLPQSGCGAGCLAATPTVPRIRRLGRLVALAGVVAAGGAVLPLLPARHRAGALRGFCGAALRAMGIRLEVRGHLPARRALVVANHVSWLDILVLLAAGDLRLVAKTEVRGWPVIGRVAARTGTVFIDRVRPKSLPHTVSAVRERLSAGSVMAVFPEGTTSCGGGLGPFRPALFQAALDAGVPVVPALLSFTTPAASPAASRDGGARELATAASFIGQESLLTSLGRILRARDLRVRVRAGTPIHPGAACTRRALARLAAAAVRAEWPARVPAGHPPMAQPPVLPPAVAAPATPSAPPPSAVRVLQPAAGAHPVGSAPLDGLPEAA